ncbi:MAG: hypothetical protein ACI8PB_005199, partial [Desulforhopalus sp.]
MMELFSSYLMSFDAVRCRALGCASGYRFFKAWWKL